MVGIAENKHWRAIQPGFAGQPVGLQALACFEGGAANPSGSCPGGFIRFCVQKYQTLRSVL
jgi:hypothetical protein